MHTPPAPGKAPRAVLVRRRWVSDAPVRTHGHSDPEIDERQVAPTLDKFLKVITNDGGSIENVDIWGKRRLAYEIQKKTEGIYAVVNFTATSAATQELDRQLKLNEQIMRTKVLRAEEAQAMIASEAKRSEEKAARKAAKAAKA